MTKTNFLFFFKFASPKSAHCKKNIIFPSCQQLYFLFVIVKYNWNNLDVWRFSEKRTFCKVMFTKLELTYFRRGRWSSQGRVGLAKLCAECIFLTCSESSGIMPADRRRMLCWILNLIWANILILVSKISCHSEQYMEVWIFASNS